LLPETDGAIILVADAGHHVINSTGGGASILSMNDSGTVLVPENDSGIPIDVLHSLDAGQDIVDAQTEPALPTWKHTISFSTNPGDEKYWDIDIATPAQKIAGWHITLEHAHHVNLYVRTGGTPNYNITPQSTTAIPDTFLLDCSGVYCDTSFPNGAWLNVPEGNFHVDIHSINVDETVENAIINI
jgi:hypothetical protein